MDLDLARRVSDRTWEVSDHDSSPVYAAPVIIDDVLLNVRCPMISSGSGLVDQSLSHLRMHAHAYSRIRVQRFSE